MLCSIVRAGRAKTPLLAPSPSHSSSHAPLQLLTLASLSLQISHALSGVEKGLASSNGMPIEIMGLLQGHIDTDDSHALIVVDAFPLPVEGTETSVVSDRPEVINYMVSLGDRLEEVSKTRLLTGAGGPVAERGVQ